jgi:hypothetical protein
MSKTTAAAVERDLNSALFGFKDSAAALKAAHTSARQAIKDDPMISDLAKREKLADLGTQTRTKLDGIKAEQQSYITGLRDKIEREFRGNQPTDAASVVSRRDAADRARKLTDRQEAMEVLNDAIANGDADLAHAIGNRARNTAMSDVAEAYQAAFPTTAESAEALASIEANTSGAAFNVSNSITFSAPRE